MGVNRPSIILVAMLFFSGCASFRNSAPVKFINDRFGTPTTKDLTPSSIRQAYVKDHPELTPEVQDAVLKGTVTKGMTQEDVRTVMGNPTARDAHDTDRLNFASWTYCYGDTIMGIDFLGGRVSEVASRSGEVSTENCKSAGRRMWAMRRGMDTGK